MLRARDQELPVPAPERPTDHPVLPELPDPPEDAGPGAHDPWDAITDVIRTRAEDDLVRRGHGGLYLAAAAGHDPLLLAASRPFEAGAYAEPIVELVALALPLGADRLAVAVTGRAWSLDDPIPPVGAAGDLRQRILSIHTVDAHDTPVPVPRDVLVPFELEGEAVRWCAPVDVGLAEGWIPQALVALLAGRDRLEGSAVRATGRQLHRCLRLGHDVVLTAEGARRLERTSSPRRA